MSILSIIRSYRNISRSRRIVQVLSQYGFGHIVLRMRLGRVPLLSRIGRVPRDGTRTPMQDIALRTRKVLEELGATFVKLGQILSYRPDLVPEEFIEEFRNLQDNVPPFPSSQALESISKSIGRDWSDVFSWFDEQPVGSGSIGQAHKARLKDGTEVIVKVKRPDVENLIASDLGILTVLAGLAEQYLPETRILRPKMLVEEFSRQLEREIDFVSEAASTEQFGQQLGKGGKIRVPQVYWDYTTRDVLCIERLSGVNSGDVENLKSSGIDTKAVARVLADEFMRQFFGSGFFHGDPHPGNILVGKDGSIGLLDFGLVGHLTDEIRSWLGTLLLGMVKRDEDLIVEVYKELGVVGEDVSARDLRMDVLELMDRYFGMPINRLDTAALFQDIMKLGRRHKVVLPRDFVLLGKSLVAVSGLVRLLDPDFNIALAAEPHARALIKEKYSPKRLIKSASSTGWSLLNLMKKLPADMSAIVGMARSGKLKINLNHEGVERFSDEMERSSNRLSLSIILASMVVGSALVMRAGVGPDIIENLPLLGVAGFTISALFGVLLALSIIRSGRI